MQYLLLIYSNEAEMAAKSPEWHQANMKGYFDFNAHLAQRGIEFGGDALEGTHTATTVRVSEGKAITTDGPFAETKEALGGYYLVDVENLDEALELAARIPAASHGCVEVRPVMQIPEH